MSLARLLDTGPELGCLIGGPLAFAASLEGLAYCQASRHPGASSPSFYHCNHIKGTFHWSLCA